MQEDWRPEGWENPFALVAMTPFLGDVIHSRTLGKYEAIFDAGAKAMLESIWKLAKDSPTGTFTFDMNTFTGSNVVHQKEDN